MSNAKLMIATGRKGVGKTTQTRKFIANYLVSKKKKVLIIDVNVEYNEYQVIRYKDLLGFLNSDEPRVGRVVPVDDYGMPLEEDNFRAVMFEIFKRFNNGLIVLEDFNRFFLNAQKRELVGLIITNRVRKIDVIIHLQSLNAVYSRFFQNTNVFRIHPQFDPIRKEKYSQMPAPQLFAIATSLMDLRFRKGNKHTYCYVDLDIVKIITNADIKELSKAIVEAQNTPPIKDMISKYVSIYKSQFRKADNDEIKRIALKGVVNEIINEYYYRDDTVG